MLHSTQDGFIPLWMVVIQNTVEPLYFWHAGGQAILPKIWRAKNKEYVPNIEIWSFLHVIVDTHAGHSLFLCIIIFILYQVTRHETSV